MIIRKDQQVLEQREHMRGGEGTVDIHHILTGENLPAHCRLIARIVLKPGCSIGEHEHQAEAELFYILNGVGIALDDGNQRELRAGDVMVTANSRHTIRNSGSEDLELLAVIVTE